MASPRLSSAQVVVYSTPWCPYCRAAEDLLRSKSVEFDRIDVSNDPSTREWLVEATGGRRTVPQIFIGGRSIGGYDELAALDRGGELAGLLSP